MTRTYLDTASTADTRRFQICRNRIFCKAGKCGGVLHYRNIQREQCLSHHRTTGDHLFRFFLKSTCSLEDLPVAHTERNLEVLRILNRITGNSNDLTN